MDWEIAMSDLKMVKNTLLFLLMSAFIIAIFIGYIYHSNVGIRSIQSTDYNKLYWDDVQDSIELDIVQSPNGDITFSGTQKLSNGVSKLSIWIVLKNTESENLYVLNTKFVHNTPDVLGKRKENGFASAIRKGIFPYSGIFEVYLLYEDGGQLFLINTDRSISI